MVLAGDSYNCYAFAEGNLTNLPLASGTYIALFKITPEGTLDWSRSEVLTSGVTIISGPYLSVSCDDVHVAATVSSSVTTPTDLLNFSGIPTGSLPSILYQRRTTTSGASQLVRLFPAGTDAGKTYLTTIESDVQSRVYLAGSFNGQITFDPLNPNANLSSEAQGKNAWIKVMTSNTEHIWSSSINGNQDDEITDLYLRGLSLVYFAGFSSSQNGLGLTPFGGSDPSGIYGKFSQSVSTGLSDFALQCPSTLSFNSNTECGLENYSFTEVQVINPCVVQFREDDAPSVLPFGNTVVTFEAVGYNGNTQQCTTSVFVQDVSLENEILCVPEIFRNTDENSCFATVSIMNPVISGNCEPVTVTNNFNNTSSITDAIFPVGTTTVVWTAFFTDEDDDGEGGLVPMTCNTKVHVSDITAPTMACVNGLTLPLTSEGIIGITVDQIDAGSFDACDIVGRTISKTEFDCSNIGPNEVLLTAVDSHGNSNSCTATVTVVDEIIPTAQCNDVEVQLTDEGTISINPDQINNNSFDNCSISNLSLSQSTFDCSHLGENTIILTVIDASELQSQCSATVVVLDLGNPPTVAAGDDLNLCGNASNVTLNPVLGEGVISVEWSGGAGTFEQGNTSASNIYIPTSAEIAAGSVTLTITVFGNSVCGSASDEIIITFSNAPTAFAGEDQQVCSDQVVVLNGASASNQTSILWTGGSGTFSPADNILQPTYTPTLEEFESGGVTLTITAEGGIGCAPVSDQIFIALAKKPLAEAGADQEICGNSVQLAGNFPASGIGTWTANQVVTYSPNANQPQATASSSGFGAITFTWTVVNSFCTSVDEVVIEFFESPTVLDAGPDQTISFQGETTLSAEGAAIGQGGWTTNVEGVLFENKEDPKTAVSGLQPGQNILYWIVTNGPCSAVQDSVIITVEGLVIPSGFSPNGDNINDTFEIKGIASFEKVSLKVLNRWGEEVFASDNYQNDWNGISKSGSELPNDTYYCVIESPILEKTHTGYIIINR
jgi:gliding motility-associated-like protein